MRCADVGTPEVRIIPYTFEDEVFSDESLEALVEKLDGCTGRDIGKLIYGIQYAVLGTKQTRITSELINKAVDMMLLGVSIEADSIFYRIMPSEEVTHGDVAQ